MLKKFSISHLIKTAPVFLFLLPLFFVWHGFIANYYEVSVGSAFLLVLMYTAIGIALSAIAWLFFRNWTKAAVFALLILALEFFYGSMQDLLQQQWPSIAPIRYRYIFPSILLFFLAAAWWLKKRKRPLQKFTTYLNVLLTVIILADVMWLVKKMGATKTDQPLIAAPEDFTVCDTCARPDIYFIIPDQYVGATALQALFNFDNSAFINELTSRGFHVVPTSSSNYNLTPFSVASTLNMNYIDIRAGRQDFGTVSYSYNLIRNNKVLKCLLAHQYQFYNCSIFNFPDQPAHQYSSFLPYGTKLITMQTFTGRLLRDFEPDILKGRFGKSLQRRFAYQGLYFNKDIFALTGKVAAMKTSRPKFVYTHLMMPHYPFYFDSKGRPIHLQKLMGMRSASDGDFLEYLRYTNKKIVELVDNILSASPTPPVIMILSDHGFRRREVNADRKYDFTNLNAIYFPDKNYKGYYDSITNVNHFRVFFNTRFGQELPLLKDSTINVLP